MGVYAISDIHGNLTIAKQIIRKAIEGNTIYFLGDACDRGNHGWQIIKMFLTTENIIYLRGNHEDMLMKAMRGYFMNDDEYRYTHAFEVWGWNGSVMTEFDITHDNFEVAHRFYSQLHTTALTADYTNSFGNIIHMSHSGYEYWKDTDTKPSVKDILWDRSHFNKPTLWYENEYNIHGHTPIPYLIKEIGTSEWDENSPIFYSDNHKIDIDMFTIKTNKACLLNLDTFETIILEGEE